MSANTVDPQTITDAVVTLLAAALVGTGKLAQEVIDYWTADLKGQSPVVMVLGAGDDPTLPRMGTSDADTWFYVEIQTWVIYSATDWTPSQAEARRAAIKKVIKDTIIDHRSKSKDATVPWDVIDFAGRSETQDVIDEGGNPYLVETTPLKARVVHG